MQIVIYQSNSFNSEVIQKWVSRTHQVYWGFLSSPYTADVRSEKLTISNFIKITLDFSADLYKGKFKYQFIANLFFFFRNWLHRYQLCLFILFQQETVLLNAKTLSENNLTVLYAQPNSFRLVKILFDFLEKKI